MGAMGAMADSSEESGSSTKGMFVSTCYTTIAMLWELYCAIHLHRRMLIRVLCTTL